MIIIQLFIGIIFALGIGCILFDVFKVPSMKASRATHNLGRKGDKKVSNIKLFLEGFAAELAPKLKLNEWKKHELEEDLRAAGMGEITPELFVARAATKALSTSERQRASRAKSRKRERKSKQSFRDLCLRSITNSLTQGMLSLSSIPIRKRQDRNLRMS